LAIPIGLASEERLQQVQSKKAAISDISGKLQKIKIEPTEANPWLTNPRYVRD
jgi:hypothetical protein